MFRTKPCFALGRLLSLAPRDGVREPNRDIVSLPDRIVSQPGAALQRNSEAVWFDRLVMVERAGVLAIP